MLPSLVRFTFLFAFIILGCSETNDELSEKAKLSMREVGNKLLLSTGDRTSLVLPIVEVAPNKFNLSFESSLEVYPDSLVKIVQESVSKAKLPEAYIVEVVRSADGEIAYSYEMDNKVDENIIPCLGRQLPNNFYSINIKFRPGAVSDLEGSTPIYLGLAFLGLTIFFLVRTKEEAPVNNKDGKEFVQIGDYMFFEKYHLLQINEREISLSKKECEILSILSANQNEIIQREILVKRVWEDHGVVVGRSLDTYISKLRKKLKFDPSIQITNAHGVGYKLEVE